MKLYTSELSPVITVLQYSSARIASRYARITVNSVIVPHVRNTKAETRCQLQWGERERGEEGRREPGCGRGRGEDGSGIYRVRHAECCMQLSLAQFVSFR